MDHKVFGFSGCKGCSDTEEVTWRRLKAFNLQRIRHTILGGITVN